MNVENFKRLIDHLKTVDKEKFSSAYWLENFSNLHCFDEGVHFPKIEDAEKHCGSVACIAGHAAIKFGEEMKKTERLDTAVQEWLGLTDKEANYLFNLSFLIWYPLPYVIEKIEEMLERGSIIPLRY